jgi:hypothetical protein
LFEFAVDSATDPRRHLQRPGAATIDRQFDAALFDWCGTLVEYATGQLE